MSANEKNKDFIDKFFEMFEQPYKSSGVRFWTIVIGFIFLFITGLIFAPNFINICINSLSIKLNLVQLAPYESLFNYLKIAFCFASFIIAPFALYQFGKLKVEKLDFENRLNLLIAAAIFFLVIFTSCFITYKFFLPAEIFFLYGLSFPVMEFTTSLSSIVSVYLITIIVTAFVILLPFMRFLIKKSLFFNYATLTKFTKPAMVYSALLAILLVLPFEFVILGLLFLFFVLWYKVLVYFAKKRD